MPITAFQREVLQLLKPNRKQESFVAGGIAIHRDNQSSRYSNDIDFFHDLDEAVTSSYLADESVLKANRFLIEILISQPSFIRAAISKGENSLKIEWVRDTAFRFFPLIEDTELGYRLHDVDLAINKVLALANRNEVRDMIDLIQLDRTTISLASACWAACGKDPGFTPELLFDCISRHAIVRPEQLAAENLVEPLSPVELKKRWLSLFNSATEQLRKAPVKDLGCLYLSRDNEVVRDPFSGDMKHFHRHFGSIGGSWPRLADT